MGGDVRAVFDRLARGIKAVGDSVKAESGKDFMLDPKYGYVHSCPTNLGTGMRASVHVDLPGYTKEGLDVLKARCEELHVQPRGTRGESGGQTGQLPGNKTLVIWRRVSICVLLQELHTTSQTSTGWVTPRFSWCRR